MPHLAWIQPGPGGADLGSPLRCLRRLPKSIKKQFIKPGQGAQEGLSRAGTALDLQVRLSIQIGLTLLRRGWQKTSKDQDTVET